MGPGGGGSSESAAARRRRCHEVLRLGIGMLVKRLVDNWDGAITSVSGSSSSSGSGSKGSGEEEVRAPAPVRSAGAGKSAGSVTALGSGAVVAAALGGDGGSGSGASGASMARGRNLLGRDAASEEQERAHHGSGGGVGAAAGQSRLYLFSGHDSSVTPLLAVLGQPAAAWPPFAANIAFELWQMPAAAAAKYAGGRRALAGAAGTAALRASSAGPIQPEYWIRILYNTNPLVVPGVSSVGGWAPLSVLRQRVMLPYAIGPEEHGRVCRATDVSDMLAEEEEPGSSSSSGGAEGSSSGGRQGAAGARRSLQGMAAGGRGSGGSGSRGSARGEGGGVYSRYQRRDAAVGAATSSFRNDHLGDPL